MLNDLMVNIRNLEYTFNQTSMFCLQIKNLEYSFNGVLGMYGLSGSGKTTFSKLLAGIIKPVSGLVSFLTNGQPTFPKIMYSPQFPEKILLGVHIGETVQQILSHNTMSTGVFDSICTYLDKFSLDFDVIKNKSGFELSGGELRRLAIALCLALSPELLILDEPTIGLGRRGKTQLYRVLEEFQQKHHIMIVSHDFNLIRKISGHYWILDRGSLIFSGDLQALEHRQDIVNRVGINALEHYLAATIKTEEQRTL
ncbi:MAG: energy-coupling factor ABC transporter ATP-binding protein [Candidatus Marinimicrobia bacterium]|nr:energy-coupling factor ABC transporter ATP-binding protein [Candidatus Neomarinimicrobiota bacterium]